MPTHLMVSRHLPPKNRITPMAKVGVHAIIQNNDGHVLLVKRNYLNYDWTIPGGILEDGESIPKTVVREVLEETGYSIKVDKLIAVGSRPSTNDVIVVLTGSILEKQQSKIDQNEISDIGFFPFDSLPEPMKPEVKKLFSLFISGQHGQLLVIE